MKRLLIVLMALMSVTFLKAEIPERPDPPRLVNDFAGIFDENESNSLESRLQQFARETSTQIVVVTIEDLEGNDPGDYAFRLGERWGVGQEGNDNGLVILLKPKVGNSRGQVFIATGYGLEGVLPDAIVNGTIIDTEMIPHFEQGDYYSGLENGIGVIMDITRGEYTAEYYQENYAQKSGGLPILAVLLLFFVVIPLLRSRGRKHYSPGKSLPLWIALGMMSGGRSHRGSFNNFSSGGGSFGGGFGGFGGGSFGGGGAGGSW